MISLQAVVLHHDDDDVIELRDLCEGGGRGKRRCGQEHGLAKRGRSTRRGVR